ncbi:hypothetical protein BH09MYX1_BH09MYX1_08610 [soil metagenome]
MPSWRLAIPPCVVLFLLFLACKSAPKDDGPIAECDAYVATYERCTSKLAGDPQRMNLVFAPVSPEDGLGRREGSLAA